MDKVAAMLLCAGTALFGFAVGAVTGGKLYAPEPTVRVVEVPKVVETPGEAVVLDSGRIEDALYASFGWEASVYRLGADHQCSTGYLFGATISNDQGIGSVRLCVNRDNTFTLLF